MVLVFSQTGCILCYGSPESSYSGTDGEPFAVCHIIFTSKGTTKKGHNMQEEWRDVVGFDGLYQISNFGKVKRKNKKHTLKPTKKDGYDTVTLCVNGKRRYLSVHRLVAQAFIPNPENKPCIDHKDGNRDNNNADNLRWCTVKENNSYPIVLQRKSGVNSPCSIPIVCVELKRIFFGSVEAAKILSLSQSHITEAAKGKQKTAGGYHWRYATPEEIAQVKAEVA